LNIISWELCNLDFPSTRHGGAWEERRYSSLLILDLGTRWGWVVSITPRPRFYPRGKDSRFPLDRRLTPLNIIDRVWLPSKATGNTVLELFKFRVLETTFSWTSYSRFISMLGLQGVPFRLVSTSPVTCYSLLTLLPHMRVSRV
jgi:hypothetical protein